MAAPIAHVFLAVQMLAGPFKGFFNEKEFIVGTSFPDIQYLKVVNRAQTHVARVALEDIRREKDSFKAGLLFHSFVDEQREAYVVANKLYAKLSSFRFTTQSLKFAEDEILKSFFDSKRYQSYFDTILAGEKTYAIPQEQIKQWHLFLQDYFRGDSSGRDFVMRYFDINEPNAWRLKRFIFSWFHARKMAQTISFIKNDVTMKHLIIDFYTHFVDTFK